VASGATVTAVAVDLRALGDPEPLWQAWLEDASRRTRTELDADRLDEQLPNWRALLERFADDRAPLYFRPSPQVTSALRALQADGVTVGVFTEFPQELARVALAHLGATRRVDAIECGPGAEQRLLERLPGARVARRTADLHS
jgi:phosphoglycolate phosphatase-like HAD superfamily hydrolase